MDFYELFSDSRLKNPRKFKRGDRLLEPDVEGYELLLLESGTVEVSRYDVDGARILQSFLSAPQCFGLIEYEAKTPLLSGIRALTDGRYYTLSPKDPLLSDPSVISLFLTYVCSLYERDMRTRAFEKHMTGKERVLFTIYRLSEAPFPHTLPLKRDDLADLLGISPRSLYRYLNELEKEGFLSRDRGKILITEIAYRAMNTRFQSL